MTVIEKLLEKMSEMLLSKEFQASIEVCIYKINLYYKLKIISIHYCNIYLVAFCKKIYLKNMFLDCFFKK